ncbi:MAG: glycosyltransferase, partial [Magnetospirillum sp.]|nr:glycosyltransferase [Magnetospirillum sp.]
MTLMQNPTERVPWARIVIVNFNGGEMIGAVVAALARQSMGDFEAVVVDNASTDGSIQRLTLPDGRFKIIHAGANLGFAAGCNLGCRDAKTPWLAMLNPDAVPDADWLKHLRCATVNHPKAAMFGSTQLRAEDPNTLDGAGDNYSIFGLAWRGGYGAQASVVVVDIPVFSPCAAA